MRKPAPLTADRLFARMERAKRKRARQRLNQLQRTPIEQLTTTDTAAPAPRSDEPQSSQGMSRER